MRFSQLAARLAAHGAARLAAQQHVDAPVAFLRVRSRLHHLLKFCSSAFSCYCFRRVGGFSPSVLAVLRRLWRRVCAGVFFVPFCSGLVVRRGSAFVLFLFVVLFLPFRGWLFWGVCVGCVLLEVVPASLC